MLSFLVWLGRHRWGRARGTTGRSCKNCSISFLNLILKYKIHCLTCKWANFCFSIGTSRFSWPPRTPRTHRKPGLSISPSQSIFLNIKHLLNVVYQARSYLALSLQGLPGLEGASGPKGNDVSTVCDDVVSTKFGILVFNCECILWTFCCLSGIDWSPRRPRTARSPRGLSKHICHCRDIFLDLPIPSFFWVIK